MDELTTLAVAAHDELGVGALSLRLPNERGEGRRSSRISAL